MKVGNEAEPPTTTYTISFDLLEIQGLSKGEYYVVVSVGPNTISSTKKKTDKSNEVFTIFFSSFLSCPFFNQFVFSMDWWSFTKMYQTWTLYFLLIQVKFLTFLFMFMRMCQEQIRELVIYATQYDSLSCILFYFIYHNC